MRTKSYKSMMLASMIITSILFSCATTQQKQSELKEANFYHNMGYAYGEKGQYDQAIANYNKAIEIDPKFATAYYNRGCAYGEKGQHDQAIANYNKAIEINPKDAEAYNNRGYEYAYGKKGQHDQAIADYNKAIEINPEYAKAYNNRGIAYYFKKEYDKSWEDVRKAKNLGYRIPIKFLEDLRKASGRQN